MSLSLVGGAGNIYRWKALGKHRYGAVHEIDTGGAFLRLLVNERSGPDVVRHVGDMDAHFPIAVGELADGECVVKILGVTRDRW